MCETQFQWFGFLFSGYILILANLIKNKDNFLGKYLISLCIGSVVLTMTPLIDGGVFYYKGLTTLPDALFYIQLILVTYNTD